MNSRRALVLHKNEWDRIRRKQNDVNIHSNEDYIKSLNEISQSWMKSWPDTVEGRVHLLKKQKENQHVKNFAFIKDYRFKKKKVSHGEKIKQARDQIFRDSCYGRRLLSALLESKTLEERDIQVEFQKKIKDEAKIREQNKFLCNSIESAFDMEKKELSLKLRQRENNTQMAKFNLAIHKMQEEQRKDNQRKNMLEYPDVLYNKSLIAQEEREKEKHKLDTRNVIETFIREQQNIKEKKKHQETDILKNIEMIQEYQDRVNCKIKAMNNKIIKERFSDRTEKVYQQLQILKEEEQRRYEKFVEAGIQRQLSKETETKQNYLNQAVKSKFAVQETENMIKTKDFDPIYNKYLSNRQCIITKSCKDKKNTKRRSKPDPKSDVFLVPPKKLVEEYRQRLQEPTRTARSGLTAAHAQFAEHATNVLRECRYKHVARNVIDEYLRVHCLDEETIPIHH